jgi:SH3-like domain-containing protein
MTEAGRTAKCDESSNKFVMIRFAAILLILSAMGAEAAPVRILRYVSQRTDKAYLREGPTYAHKVLWVYRHRGTPFAVIAEFDVWRRVQAPDGTLGWMSAAMLTDQRTVLVTGKGRARITAEADGGKVVALADPGAIAGLKACGRTACRIHGESIDGWIPKDRIWGVDTNEVFDKISAR